MSSILRPFTFHIGASWAGKPADHTKVPKVPFPPNTLVGAWRDHTLSRKKAVRSHDAGEDFFYVQEVRLPPAVPLKYELNQDCFGKRCGINQ